MTGQFTNFQTDGKAAPRVVDILDWNRDGQVDLLLQVYGISDTWFEAVGKNAEGKWQTTFRDRCDSPGTSSIPVAGAVDSSAASQQADTTGN